MRDPAERLRDILEAIERIERRAPADKEAFLSDELLHVWVVHHLQVIGEAVRAVPSDVRALAPDLPWRSIVGMRNVLVHQYFVIDTDAVWAVVERDLAPLRAEVETLLRQVGTSGTDQADHVPPG